MRAIGLLSRLHGVINPAAFRAVKMNKLRDVAGKPIPTTRTMPSEKWV